MLLPHSVIGSQTNDPYFNNVSLLLKPYKDNLINKDYSKNNHTISVAGNTAISSAQAKWGNKSIYFDGNGDYLSGSLTSSFNIRTTPHSIEAWVYFSSTTNSVIFNSDENYYPVEIYQNYFYVGDAIINNINQVSTSAIIQNGWNFVIVTFDGATYKLGLNGNLIGSSTTLLKSANILNFQIGARTVYGVYLYGLIGELRVTPNNVRPISVPTQPFPNW